MQQECNFNFITNGWARLATCGWARHFFQDYCIPKQHLITLRLLWNSNFPCNVRALLWNLWLNTKHLRNFRSDDLSQHKSCKEIFGSRTKKNSNKTFLKNYFNTQFHLYSLKVSGNAKILCDVLTISGGTNAPPLVARLVRDTEMSIWVIFWITLKPFLAQG